MLKTIQTKLETADRDEISVILDSKAMTVGANQTADYVGFAIENIESAKERIKNAIAELQETRKALEAQEQIIKAGVSEWLTSNGIEKLNGDRISSITAYEKKESIELVITDEEALINHGYFKMQVDKTAVKNALQEGANIEGALLEIIHNEPSIKVNKKRKKDENNT